MLNTYLQQRFLCLFAILSLIPSRSNGAVYSCWNFFFVTVLTYKDTNKTGSVVWSGSMDVDEERRTICANFWKENI